MLEKHLLLPLPAEHGPRRPITLLSGPGNAAAETATAIALSPARRARQRRPLRTLIYVDRAWTTSSRSPRATTCPRCGCCCTARDGIHLRPQADAQHDALSHRAQPRLRVAGRRCGARAISASICAGGHAHAGRLHRDLGNHPRADPEERYRSRDRAPQAAALTAAPPQPRRGPAAELVLAADQFIITPVGRVEDAARAAPPATRSER